MACIRKLNDAIKLFVLIGADVNVKDCWGKGININYLEDNMKELLIKSGYKEEKTYSFPFFLY